MFSDFRKVFKPTKEELQKRNDFINELIRQDYNDCGECCHTCKHKEWVQESPYYDYVTCKYDKSLEFGYGEGSIDYVCDKYEFQGYLEISDGDSDGTK